MKTINLTDLHTLDEHPSIADARKTQTDAQRLCEQAAARRTEAENELRAAEHAAATGARDDKRLRAAQEALVRCQSEIRIATARVEDVQQRLTDAYRDTCIEVHRELEEAQRAAVQRLDTTLSAAQRASHEVALLELASSRLFPGGPYRTREQLPGQPLPRLAWWREFGGPDTPRTTETRYGYWRKFVGLDR